MVVNTETNLQDDMGDAAVKQRLLDTLHRPENACCADCNAPSPKCVHGQWRRAWRFWY
jgi:hypothetical protein